MNLNIENKIMKQYIDKDILVAEIKEYIDYYNKGYANGDNYKVDMLKTLLHDIDFFEVKDPYEQCVQYDFIKAGIQAHAETYSFNIESVLFNQLTKEQQELWRKEIEQAVISGGDVGYLLAKDTRYKENSEAKEVDLEKEAENFVQTEEFVKNESPVLAIAKYFFELGLNAQKGE